jgi:hypothetical protein
MKEESDLLQPSLSLQKKLEALQKIHHQIGESSSHPDAFASIYQYCIVRHVLQKATQAWEMGEMIPRPTSIISSTAAS